jgi:hypothetical protein
MFADNSFPKDVERFFDFEEFELEAKIPLVCCCPVEKDNRSISLKLFSGRLVF